MTSTPSKSCVRQPASRSTFKRLGGSYGFIPINLTLRLSTIHRILPYADQLKIITNIIEGSGSSKIAADTIGQLPMSEDFGFAHWQYIGAKLGYKSNWAKTAFYKYTVRKRLKIRTDRPDAGLELIYAIAPTVPTEPVLHPENWTSERESAENYIQFSLTQGRRYYLVPLMRTANGEWKVAVQVVS
jgi:hypothetical protein